MTHGLQKRNHPKTEAERRAWIRKKQATAEMRNIKKRLKAGLAKPTDAARIKELEFLI